jgi:hypothetical protein
MKLFLTTSILRSTIRLGVLTLLIGLSACSPKVLQIKPLTDEFKEEQGQQIVKQWKEGIKIVTAYDGEFDNFVVFDTEIFNQTADTLKIDPSVFTIVPFAANRDSIKSERGYGLMYYAADPEDQVKRTELAMKRAKKMHTINTVFNVLLLAANVYSDVSSASKSKTQTSFESSRWAHQNNYDLLFAKQQIDNISYQNRLEKLHYARGNWGSEPFKKSFLMPNESLRGRIYLPKNKQAAIIKMAYPVPSGDEIAFWFDQKLVKRPEFE